MKKSLKHLQSELGVTGEPSPNFLFIEEAISTIREQFVCEPDTATENDCLIMISSCRPGEKLKKMHPDEIGVVSLRTTIVGSDEDLTAILSEVLYRDDRILCIFMDALNVAMIKKLKHLL